MQMPKHISSYSQGMNKDISYNEYPNTCFFDAHNLRLITSDSSGLSNDALATPKGNAASFTLPNSGILLGHIVLRDYLIVLAHAAGQAKPDRIYKIALSKLKTASNLTINNNYYWLDPANNYLVYWENLNFNLSNPIRVVGNYENATTQKIYWVDGLNSLRHINTIYNSVYNKLDTMSSNLLDILPDNTYGTYTLSESLGGNLTSGRIQYSYQLYSVAGTETMFAPPSSLYNLTSSSVSDDINFVGTDIGIEVGKNITISISLPSGTSLIFNRIRLVALQYEEYNDTPVIRVITEQALSTDSPSFIDYGNSIGELVLEEFQVIRNDIVPTTIESKNNYLFASNLTEQFFDLDEVVEDLGIAKTYFDSRAYRWRYCTTGSTISGTQELVTSTLIVPSTDPVAAANPNPPNRGLASGSFKVDVLAMENDEGSTGIWGLKIYIGSKTHAAAQVPVRTVTSIATVNDHLVLDLYDGTNGWNETLELDSLDPNSTSYDYATDTLTVYGTSFGGVHPNDLLFWDLAEPHLINYTKQAVVTLTYTYNYTYTSSAGSSECVINKGMTNGSTELVIDSGLGPDYTLVSEDNDCVNTYNNILNDEDLDRAHEYKYKYITGAAHPTIADLGGTGPYISYEFITEDIPIGTMLDCAFTTVNIPIIYSTVSSKGYQDPQTVIDVTSYQRNEVYRFALEAYDLKGRPSFVKWIADIRFPNFSEELDPGSVWDDTYRLCATAGANPEQNMIGKTLGIKFIIDWDAINTDYPGLLSQLSGIQIVRCDRTDNDSTIKAQGLILPTHVPDTPAGQIKDAAYSTYNITSAKDYEDSSVTTIATITGGNSSMERDIVELLSPEIAVNKSLTINTNDFLEVLGQLGNIYTNKGIVAPGGYTYHYYGVTGTTITTFNSNATDIAGSWRKSIDEGIISLPEAKSPVTHVIGGIGYVARGYNDDVHGDDPKFTFKGTTLVVKTDAVFSNVTGALIANGGEEAMYGRYRRYMGYSIYGGASYSERSYNTYIQVSEFIPIPDPIAVPPVEYEMYNGDMYITPFCFLKLSVDIAAEYPLYSGQVVVSFPVETKINLNYLSNSLPRYFKNSADSGDYHLSERQSDGISQYPNNYPDIGNLYRYNSAYSAVDKSKVFLSKPFDFISSIIKDVIVTSSEPKINGEYSDSWLRFKFNNYIELEGEFGAVTRLVIHGDKMLAFQPRGISVLSILERELIETNNTQTLAVGNGGVLSRYDYISKQSGSSLYDAIVPTELGLYFYDDYNIKIYRIIESVEPLSDVKGMKSYFETNPITNVIATYDKKNREVLFGLDTTTNTTLTFSGFKDSFAPFYDYYSIQNIPFDRYLLQSTDGNKFYLNDSGNYLDFFGTVVSPSLTLIVNPIKTNVVTLHEIEWLMDVTNAGIEEYAETFSNITISDTTQNTGLLTLLAGTTTGLTKRFRKWRINIFRHTDNGRIRDSWFKVLFNYTPLKVNNKAVIHPIIFSYLPTKI